MRRDMAWRMRLASFRALYLGRLDNLTMRLSYRRRSFVPRLKTHVSTGRNWSEQNLLALRIKAVI